MPSVADRGGLLTERDIGIESGASDHSQQFSG
jgi:hypothetical protein